MDRTTTQADAEIIESMQREDAAKHKQWELGRLDGWNFRKVYKVADAADLVYHAEISGMTKLCRIIGRVSYNGTMGNSLVREIETGIVSEVAAQSCRLHFGHHGGSAGPRKVSEYPQAK